MYITTLLRCFLSVESVVVNISQQRSTKSRPFDPASSVTFSSDVSWHRALWVYESMSLSVSLCGVSILPQFCRNSAAILPQFAAMVCWLCCGVLSVFIPKYSKYLTESDKCALRVLSRKIVLLLQGRISVLLLCGRILVKHLWFHSEWKTKKRREKWREVKRSKLTWAYMSLHQAGSLKGSEYLSQV